MADISNGTISFSTIVDKSGLDENGNAVETFTFTKELGSSLTELIETFGEEVVFTHAITSMQTQARNLAYSHKKEKDGDGNFINGLEELEALMENWQPTAVGKASRKSPEEKAATIVAKMSPEEKAALIAQLNL